MLVTLLRSQLKIPKPTWAKYPPDLSSYPLQMQDGMPMSGSQLAPFHVHENATLAPFDQDALPCSRRATPLWEGHEWNICRLSKVMPFVPAIRARMALWQTDFSKVSCLFFFSQIVEKRVSRFWRKVSACPHQAQSTRDV